MTRIRWGILGNAKIARDWVVPSIKVSHNGDVVALASRDPAKGRQTCERFAILALYDDYASLLSSPEVDAVYIPAADKMFSMCFSATSFSYGYLPIQRAMATMIADSQ